MSAALWHKPQLARLCLACRKHSHRRHHSNTANVDRDEVSCSLHSLALAVMEPGRQGSAC